MSRRRARRLGPVLLISLWLHLTLLLLLVVTVRLRPPGRGTAAALDGRDGVRGRQAGRAGAAESAAERCGADRNLRPRRPRRRSRPRTPPHRIAAGAARSRSHRNRRRPKRRQSPPRLPAPPAPPPSPAGTAEIPPPRPPPPLAMVVPRPRPAAHRDPAAPNHRSHRPVRPAFPTPMNFSFNQPPPQARPPRADDVAGGAEHAGLLARAATGRHRQLAVLARGRCAGRPGLAQRTQRLGAQPRLLSAAGGDERRGRRCHGAGRRQSERPT